MAAEESKVEIDSTRFLRRLQRLNGMLLKRPEDFGTCLQLAHGKRNPEEMGEHPYVVSCQVRAPSPPTPTPGLLQAPPFFFFF